MLGGGAIGGSNSFVAASRPPVVICHICGRQYGTASITIHIKSCTKKFEEEEAKKPKSQRRPVPSATVNYDEISTMSGAQLEKHNEVAFKQFNDAVLMRCGNCGRTFLPDRLAIHHRSCTTVNPARRVLEKGVGNGGTPTTYVVDSNRNNPMPTGASAGAGAIASPARPSTSTMNQVLSPSNFDNIPVGGGGGGVGGGRGRSSSNPRGSSTALNSSRHEQGGSKNSNNDSSSLASTSNEYPSSSRGAAAAAFARAASPSSSSSNNNNYNNNNDRPRSRASSITAGGGGSSNNGTSARRRGSSLARGANAIRMQNAKNTNDDGHHHPSTTERPVATEAWRASISQRISSLATRMAYIQESLLSEVQDIQQGLSDLSDEVAAFGTGYGDEAEGGGDAGGYYENDEEGKSN